jgi:hypothetical protein
MDDLFVGITQIEAKTRFLVLGVPKPASESIKKFCKLKRIIAISRDSVYLKK